MSEVELKPCPFCGGRNAMAYPPTCHKSTPYNPQDRMHPIVRCQCGAEVPGKDNDGANDSRSAVSAIAAWNTRATAEADALRAEVARLRKCVDAMNGTVQIAHALEDGGISDQWAHVFEDLLSDQCAALKGDA